jgi:biopolymer transport protein ExbD
MKIKKFDSINVVPFIDIILVLLVIVLTTATFVAKGIIPVDLSQAKSDTKLIKQKSLNITITKDNKIYFDKNIVKDISLALRVYKQNTIININCDKEVKFDIFIKLLDTLKKGNYSNLNIITRYEK